MTNLQRIDEAIQEGLDDLANGRYTDYSEDGLARFFEESKARGRERLKAIQARKGTRPVGEQPTDDGVS